MKITQNTYEEKVKNSVAEFYNILCDSNEAQIGPVAITFTGTGQIVLHYDNGNIAVWNELTPIIETKIEEIHPPEKE